MEKNNNSTQLYFKQPRRIHSRISRTSSVPLHWHDFYEIELVISGRGTHTINGSDYLWQTGEMHFIRLTDFHQISLEEAGMLHLIQIRPSRLPEKLLHQISLTEGNLVTQLTLKDFSYANALCLMIEEETSRSEDYDELLVENLLSALISMFFKSYGANSNDSKYVDDALLGKLVIYINENFRSALSLEQIADHFFISKNYLCFYFKKHMNQTIMQYIKNLRLEYAAKLTTTTDIKSIEISQACGYGSVSNFLRDFKKHYGISPLEMRKNNQSLNK